jgi:hypothetical protein
LQRQEGRGKALTGKGGGDDVLLPTCDEGVRGMLQLASAAGAGVAAWRPDAVRGRGDDLGINQPVAVRRSLDHLTRKRAWHVDRPQVLIARDAVTEVA